MPVCNYQGLLVACGDSLLHMWVVPATHIQNLRIAYGSKESNSRVPIAEEVLKYDIVDAKCRKKCWRQYEIQRRPAWYRTLPPVK
jgi:hypothetical protein